MKKLAFLSIVALMVFSAPVMAADVAVATEGGSWVLPGGQAGIALGVSLGAGLIVIGAAKGIGNIGSSAAEMMYYLIIKLILVIFKQVFMMLRLNAQI